MSKSKGNNIVLKVLRGDLLEMKSFQRHIPYILFLSGLGVIYIGFSYATVKKVQQIDRLESELRELRSEAISLKNEVKQRTRKFELAARLSEQGLRIATTPPRVVEVAPDSLKRMY
jgi:hypothetical protein